MTTLTADRITHSVAHGLWRLADPKIALASLVPFCAGMAIAWRATHHVDFGVAAAAFAAIFLVEVGKNAVNDLYDFRSGADTAVLPQERSPFSGGKRVIVDGLLGESELVVIAWVTFFMAGVIGTAAAIVSRPTLLILGAAAALVSVLYAMPPVHLAYRGLGELAVGCVYGPGILLGTVMLMRATVTVEAVLASVTLGILIALVLLLNEMPDERPDRVAGKRTLVVRLGRDRATLLTGFLFFAAFAIPLAWWAWDEPLWITGALAGAPVALLAYTSLARQPYGPPVAAQTWTLVTYVVTGAGVVWGAIA